MAVGARARRMAFVSVLLLAGGPARGQEFKQLSFVVEAPRSTVLNIAGDVSNLLTLTQDAGESAYDAGFCESAADATRLSFSCSYNWDLSANLADSWTCPGTYDKAENDLSIRVTAKPATASYENGSNDYINLTSDNTQIVSGPALLGVVIRVQTKVALDWTRDVPGAYGITLTYTLVQHIP